MASLKVQCAFGYQAAVAGSERRLGGEIVRPEGNEREQAEQRRGGAHDREVGPLALGFDAEMGTGFLEGDLELPAGDEPLEDIDRSGVEIGAEEGLRLRVRRADRGPAATEWAPGADPQWYQTAVPVAISTARLVRPYQRVTVWRCQTVSASCSTWLSVGRRLPLTGGRPRPGRLGGAGAYRLASRRNRVTTLT